VNGPGTPGSPSIPRTPSSIDRRVRIAAALVGAGLLVEILVLRGVHPSAFLIFVFAGIPLVAAGVFVFLHSLVSAKN
jgi:hypothetical protein